MKKKRSMKVDDMKVVLTAVSVFMIGGLALVANAVINRQTTQDIRSQAAQTAPRITGNGAPSGAHYNLNILGKVDKDCNTETDTSAGRRIFVPLVGKASISLTEAPEFAVIDYCGTDGKASFSLPNPDPDNDGVTTYSVWAVAKGKPGGSASMTTCAIDGTTGENICSIYSTVQVREAGKGKFTDVSKSLLYIYADLDLDGSLERYPLFDDALQGYYWDYDNNGLKLLKLRFYPVSSAVPAP
ncbi:MAG TPA: hypothetical protein PKX78_03850 [Candidatus Woesebacteria bacterium]|nr:hypothetical protein [Candidatus Woesebacteria bacterium]